MINKNEIYFVIPAYNESSKIGSVIQRLNDLNYTNIVVVDDCSTDNTSAVLSQLNVVILKHSLNRGAGAATKTGIDAALILGAKYVVTIDGDGQHDPQDVEKLLKYADKYDVVIGSRMIRPKNMPFMRKLYNFIGSIITFILYGIYVKDSQSGYKVFNRESLEKINIKFDRYEFCSEILHEIKLNKLKFKEVPIKVIYTNYSLSKGQSFLSGVRMVHKMIMRFFI